MAVPPTGPSTDAASPPADPAEPAIFRSNEPFALSLADAEAGLPPSSPPTHIRHRALIQQDRLTGDGGVPARTASSSPAPPPDRGGDDTTPEFEFNRTQSEPNLQRPKLNSRRGNNVRNATLNNHSSATTPSNGNRPALLTKATFVNPKPLAAPPGWRVSAMHAVKYSYLNVLLVFIPISWAMHFTHQSPTVTFAMSFAAIIPLAALLGFATEELALRTSDTVGGLLNATFGNCVELIISILALVKGELRIVQSSMLGSILSNCLLVLGMCYFAGGLRFHEQGYGVRAAQLNINLLGISVAAIVIPVAFHAVLAMNEGVNLDDIDDSVRNLSHGIAICLLFLYAGYLTFQLWTHAYLYLPAPRGPDDPPPPPVLPFIEGPQPPTEGRVFRLPSWGSHSSSSSSSSASTHSSESEQVGGHHAPKMSLWASLALLTIVTVITGFTAEWLVDSIDGLTATGNISREFVALILLPLVGNAAEHLTAVTVATKNKLDLSMAVAVGSSVQISLFVIPLLICLGWIIGQPLTLYFDLFETIVLFVAIVSVNWAIQDGRSNWMEGMTLMLYVIIAVTAWYYPSVE
ncbi:vacuolar calcium ion transporter h(+) exchanger [Pseudohyphozyma bogoriensis]|nr:vacuolar calcium ion transporter h(+) exchanger [Pseudohyphozyma bogoriensis]